MLAMAAIAVWFIATVRSLKKSIDALIPEMHGVSSQISSSASQISSKADLVFNQITSMVPFFSTFSNSAPEILETGREIALRVEGLKKSVDQFYRRIDVALASSGAISPNGNEDSGFWGYSESRAAVSEAEEDRFRSTGVMVPADQSEVVIEGEPRVPLRGK